MGDLAFNESNTHNILYNYLGTANSYKKVKETTAATPRTTLIQKWLYILPTNISRLLGGRNLTTSLLLSVAKEISKPPFVLVPEVQ